MTDPAKPTAPLAPRKTPASAPSRPRDTRPTGDLRRNQEPPETVDPGWLLRAALGAVLFAALCTLVTISAVFWKTQWQLVLHPSASLAHSPADLHLPFQEVHFSPGPDGQSQLTGWWIPAADAASQNQPATPTALLLHGGDGNRADALPLACALHEARLDVLLFDYRGFGPGAVVGGPTAHPSQFTMQQDADAALAYLESIRHLPAASILPVGEGLGASLAVRLAAAHRDLPAVILRSPRGDFAEEAKRDTRSRLIPFKLLFHENFPLADPLHTLATPKLILSDGHGKPSEIAQRAADPKLTVEGLENSPAALTASLRRFLDSYVPHPPQELRPSQPSNP